MHENRPNLKWVNHGGPEEIEGIIAIRSAKPSKCNDSAGHIAARCVDPSKQRQHKAVVGIIAISLAPENISPV